MSYGPEKNTDTTAAAATNFTNSTTTSASFSTTTACTLFNVNLLWINATIAT